MNEACRGIRERLVEYADGELDAFAAVSIDAHVNACARCRRVHAALRQSLDVARQIWETRAAQTKRSPARARPRLPFVLKTAAAATLLFCVLFKLPVREEAALTGHETLRDRVLDTVIAAQVLSAAELLLDTPEGRALANAQLARLVEQYPETPAGHAGRALLSETAR